MYQIKINGLREVTSFLNRLPKEINKNIKTEGVLELAKNLQRRIKYRAPMGPTGWLKRSVMIEKNGKTVSVTVNAHYALAVEKGRRAGSFIPRFYMEQHIGMPDAPGQTLSKSFIKETGGYFDPAGTKAGTPRPFIIPAIESWKPKINEILLRHTEKALSKAGGMK